MIKRSCPLHFANAAFRRLASACAEDNFWDEYLRVGKDLDIRRFPYLYLDRQPCNRSLYNCVVGALSGRLGMSKEAVKQRLIDMGLLIVEDNACGYWDNAGAILKRRELNSLICWI